MHGALILFGMLQLRSAMASSRDHDRPTTTELLGDAEWAADLLGEDANHWQTGFGPTNVEMHRLAAALELGDVAYVADRARDGEGAVPAQPGGRRSSPLMGLALRCRAVT